MTLSNITTDPIADMLTRIRNGLSNASPSIQVPMSRLKLQLLKVLKAEGYISDFKTSKDGEAIDVTLAGPEEPSRLTYLRRLSRPGRRLHVKASDIPVVRQGQGIVVVSTSQGLMAGHKAKARRLGGELICEVW